MCESTYTDQISERCPSQTLPPPLPPPQSDQGNSGSGTGPPFHGSPGHPHLHDNNVKLIHTRLSGLKTNLKLMHISFST